MHAYNQRYGVRIICTYEHRKAKTEFSNLSESFCSFPLYKFSAIGIVIGVNRYLLHWNGFGPNRLNEFILH